MFLELFNVYPTQSWANDVIVRYFSKRHTCSPFLTVYRVPVLHFLGGLFMNYGKSDAFGGLECPQLNLLSKITAVLLFQKQSSFSRAAQVITFFNKIL